MVRKMTKDIPIFHGLDEKDRLRLSEEISASYLRANKAMPDQSTDDEEAEDAVVESDGIPEVPDHPNLIGVESSVYRQINSALQSGKQHLMLYGPPGTGKTELARWIANQLHDNWRLITGSADWTSQDVIGGYQPIGDGSIRFVPGVLLDNFDRPLIIDELNRCDIDKVIGPLFTVLSGQPTTLPYRMDVRDEQSPAYEILPVPKAKPSQHEFAPKIGWRLLATINTVDKAALYQMSFALARRFAWIYIDVPRDTYSFVLEYLRTKQMIPEETAPTSNIPIAKVWESINQIRPIGAAPIIDMIKSIVTADRSSNFLKAPQTSEAHSYLDALEMYVLPMLDGIMVSEAEKLATQLSDSLALSDESVERQYLFSRLSELSV